MILLPATALLYKVFWGEILLTILCHNLPFSHPPSIGNEPVSRYWLAAHYWNNSRFFHFQKRAKMLFVEIKKGQKYDVVREACPCQNGWIFGETPNGLWPHPLPAPFFGKMYCKFFQKFMTKIQVGSAPNLQWIFLDWKWPFPWKQFGKMSTKMDILQLCTEFWVKFQQC